MTTTIKRLESAFASTVVAVYEPLIVRWTSWPGLLGLVDGLSVGLSASQPAARALERRTLRTTKARRAARSRDSDEAVALEAVRLAYPQASRTGNTISLDGIDRRVEVAGGAGPIVGGLSAILSREQRALADEFREGLTTSIPDVLDDLLKSHEQPIIPASELRAAVLTAAKEVLKEVDLGFKPPELVQLAPFSVEFLSPIGIAHYFRQIYFSVGEGVGPIEQAFTIAPKESLEFVVETVRSQTHEEINEIGLDSVTEVASESRDINEIADKVSSMLQRENSTAISVGANFSAQGGTAFFTASGGANFAFNTNMANASTQAREVASRRLKEITKRASERISRSYRSQVRETTSATTTTSMRRTISNEGAVPINYGLRRVFNKLQIQIQSLGPRLVWQVYVPEPGRRLARSKYVYFQANEPLSSKESMAVPPRPTGDSDRGSTVAAIVWSGEPPYDVYIDFTIATPPGRAIKFVSIESLTDVESSGTNDSSARKTAPIGPPRVQPPGGNTIRVMVQPGRGAKSVRVDYVYSWDPSQGVIDDWVAQKDAAKTELENKEADARVRWLQAEFERNRQYLVDKSRVRSRPSADLRKEEQYEVLSAIVQTVFYSNQAAFGVSPLNIEQFSQYFDLSSLFCFVHPSWWRPRYVSNGADPPSYDIAADTEPAPFGSSLGWMLQLDGDWRRNEFLNSPWVRACIAINPKREREALQWLSEHVEGKIGFDPGSNPLRQLLADIESYRAQEAQLGSDGPEYASFSPQAIPVAAPAGPGAAAPVVQPNAAVYPIVASFEVTTPTEGFLYDDLQVTIP